MAAYFAGSPQRRYDHQPAPKPILESNRAIAAGGAQSPNPEANRRRRAVEHMRAAEHLKADGRIATAMRTNQGDIRCRLKPAEGIHTVTASYSAMALFGR
jgi:hypothetical protein